MPRKSAPAGEATRPSLSIICGAPGFVTDAIRDYTQLLGDSLTPYFSPVIYERSGTGAWTVAQPRPTISRDEDLASALADSDSVIVQYNPFSFGRWGFAPWLAREIWRLRRMANRPRIALMVHESFVPATNFRFAVMSSWQRGQLFALVHASDIVFASTTTWLKQVRRLGARAKLVHLPVASNLPDQRGEREGMRTRLGIDADSVVLATLGSAHPSRGLAEIAAAVTAAADTGLKIVLLNLGAEAPKFPSLDPRIRVDTPGKLPALDLAASLSAADVYLTSFVDGVSTRRGSLMAALQHGLPTVGTMGEKTDALLLDQPGLMLEPVGASERFAAAARSLVSSAELRARVGKDGRSLYEREFDWPIIASKLATELGLSAARPRQEIT